MRLDHGLHRVPVDRVPVDRVVLRPRADRLHSGSQQVMQPARSSASQTGSRFAPGGRASSTKASRAASGHGSGSGLTRAPRFSAVTGEMLEALAGGQRARPEPGSGSSAVSTRARPTSASPAAVDDQPVRRRCGTPGRRSRRPKLTAPVAGGPTGAPPGTVRSTAWAIRRAAEADLAAQVVGLGEPQQLGDLVDLGGEQPVQVAAGGEVQGVADVEQALVRDLDRRRAGGRSARSRRARAASSCPGSRPGPP